MHLEEKTEIRRRVLAQRSAMTKAEAKQKGEAILGRLMSTDLYRQARCLSCYVSVKNEADTLGLIRVALDGERRVGVPLVGGGGKMALVEIRSLSDLHPAPFDLLEPRGPGLTEIPPEAFDLVIVPGLAFDRQGNRTGFGGGYYDRFLARATAPKVALAYDFQVIDGVPADPHDVRMDYLVTEAEICVCGETQ